MADNRLIHTPTDEELEELTQLRLRAIRRARVRLLLVQ